MCAQENTSSQHAQMQVNIIRKKNIKPQTQSRKTAACFCNYNPLLFNYMHQYYRQFKIPPKGI